LGWHNFAKLNHILDRCILAGSKLDRKTARFEENNGCGHAAQNAYRRLVPTVQQCAWTKLRYSDFAPLVAWDC
jgi:hypothetical protein